MSNTTSTKTPPATQGNKYQRLLDNCTEDLKTDCLVLARAEEVTIELLVSLEATISSLKAARLSWQVWNDAKLS